MTSSKVAWPLPLNEFPYSRATDPASREAGFFIQKKPRGSLPAALFYSPSLSNPSIEKSG